MASVGIYCTQRKIIWNKLKSVSHMKMNLTEKTERYWIRQAPLVPSNIKYEGLSSWTSKKSDCWWLNISHLIFLYNNIVNEFIIYEYDSVQYTSFGRIQLTIVSGVTKCLQISNRVIRVSLATYVSRVRSITQNNVLLSTNRKKGYELPLANMTKLLYMGWYLYLPFCRKLGTWSIV